MKLLTLHFHSRLIAASLLVFGLTLAGCDYGYVKDRHNPVGPGTGNDTIRNTIDLTLTPAQAAIKTGETQQFNAVVTGTANTSVAWSITSGPGSISGSGLYTAPATIAADPTVVTVRAVSVADTSASASASVTVVRPGGGGDTLAPGEICFEREVLPIFQSNCAMSGCHDAVTREKGYNFTNYNGIISGGDDHESLGEILEKITETRSDKRMPPSPRNRLTAAQIETIRKWIEQGAKETKCSDTGSNGCDTTNVTFSASVRPVLLNNCVGCHSGGNPPLGVNLETYAGVKAAVDDNDRFRRAINHLGYFPMPKGGKKLPDCNLSQINAWLNQGAPNN